MGPGICARKTLQMFFGVGGFTDETYSTWIFIIWKRKKLLSPIEFIQYMEKLALWIPSNKIIGYGSDELTVLNSCAAAEMYRDYMAKILSDLTSNGYMTEKEVIFYANRVSRENAKEHFNL